MNRGKNPTIKFTLFVWLFLIFLLSCAGCGNDINENAVISSAVNTETPMIEGNEIVVDSDNSYYIDLEKKLNDELDVNRAPDKCAAQGLTKIVLNFTTDEIQTCSTYDLSKISATAYFSDKTAEVITPAWSTYSGGGTLDGTVYTATNKPAIIVFKAIYSENGMSKLALFRLTVTGLISISFNKTTDEIQLPATYDLSTELIITAKLSNGTTKVIVKGDLNLKWTLTSGAGTLVEGVYTPSAKVETATFTANYTENGVAKAAQFKLKVMGLSSLILSTTTDEVNSCETYNLASKIIVSNKLSNGSINDITSSPNLTWALSSGSGILDGNVYTAPAKSETAVFTASYTEAGITKTAQFRLKVTGLSSVVLDKTTDEIMLPATYDLALEINAIVKFSDGDSKSVDLIWTLSSGSGNLSGSLYTPAAQAETAVFIGSYTENGITTTAQFKLKVIGLSSLTLSKTTDEVVSCATYDLSQITVTDKLSNGTINDITNSTTWKLISGFGTLSGKTYTTPARAETAVFAANYTEAGITKIAQFRLKVIALVSLKLSKATDEAQILVQYDLASNITVTAKLSSGQSKSVTGTNPNLKWTLSYGSGALSGTLYTPPERIETAVITATYTENGVAQSAQLRLKSTATLREKVELVGLTLSKTTDSVVLGQTYDLSKLIIIAKFNNKTTAEVSLSWIITSGGGAVAGNIFTAPANVETVRLMGSCVAEDGSVKSVNFTLKVLTIEDYNTIDSVSALIGPNGGNLTLKNGVTLEILQNGVNSLTNITFSQHINSGNESMNTYRIKSDKQITEGKLIAPAEPSAIKEYFTACYISLNNELLHLNIELIDSKYVVNLKDAFTVNYNINNQMAPNNKTLAPGNTYYDHFLVTEEYKRTQGYDNYDINTFSGEINRLNCAYYNQYFKECWAASSLSFIKTYKINAGNDFNTIPKLLYYFKTSKNGSRNLTYVLSKYNLLDKMLAAAGKVIAGEVPIDFNEEIYNKTNIRFIEKIFANKYDFAKYALICLSNRKPILLNMEKHGIIITGYESQNNKEIDINNIDLNDLLFVYNDPAYTFNNQIKYKRTITDITNEWSSVFTDLVTNVHTPLSDCVKTTL